MPCACGRATAADSPSTATPRQEARPRVRIAASTLLSPLLAPHHRAALRGIRPRPRSQRPSLRDTWRAWGATSAATLALSSGFSGHPATFPCTLGYLMFCNLLADSPSTSRATPTLSPLLPLTIVALVTGSFRTILYQHGRLIQRL